MSKFSTIDSSGVHPLRLPPVLPSHTGRRYLVTGAARGLGKAVAALLSAQGASVWAVDILEDDLAATAAELGLAGHGRIDVADEQSIADAVDAARAGLGGFDGVVNIAGIVLHADPLEISWSDWRRLVDINLIGTYEVSRRGAKAMIEDGVRGAIVNTASEAGKVGHADSLAYSATKAAVISQTRVLSESLARYDINVNCVCPGGLPTAMLREVADAYSEIVGEDAASIFDKMIATQLGRHTALEEVAAVYSFLLSDAAYVIRGQAVNADAGGTPY